MDAIRTGESVELYFNDRREGWSGAQIRRRGATFPVSFSDPRVKLADITGDGLTDVVLVYNRQLQYWPNLGYGRWDTPKSMAIPMGLGEGAAAGSDGYDPRRLLIGDLDGDGCADLVYVGDGQLTLWVNRGGRTFAPPVVIRGTPRVHDMVNVRLSDMLGHGTAGVLWTYAAGSQRESTYKFLDLTGGTKPYLFSSLDNHMGARTTIEYAPSTRFALEDALQGRRWRTTLPFPVQVVARVNVAEAFSGSRLTSRFVYHHGYWDGAEREFRGFARVDRFDTELISGGTPPAHYAPPTETRTWFHMGPVGPESGSWTAGLNLSHEYWSGDSPILGPTDISALPTSLPRRAFRDALRTLAGRPLRTELYGLDGGTRQSRPYEVTEQRYGVAPILDGRAGDDRAWQASPVFFPHALAHRSTQWERGDDPMTSATFTDGHDDYGRPTRTTAVAVARGREPRVNVDPGSAAPYLATTTAVTFATRDDGTRYLTDRVASTARHGLLNDGTLSLEELHSGAVDGSIPRRLRGLDLTHYDGEPFVGLPVGELGKHGLATRTEQLAFTQEMLAELCPAGAPPYLTGPPASWPAEYPAVFRSPFGNGAGYRWHDAGEGYVPGYYVQSRRVRLDLHDDPLGGRGLTTVERDPLGNDTTVGYDGYRLFPVRVRDAAGLETAAEYEYRHLRPIQTTDPNGNRARVAYNPLGLVAWAARLGKEGQQEGDTPEQPGVTFDYGLSAWDDSGPSARQPLWVHSLRRIEHRWETVRLERERRAAAGLPPPTDIEITALFPADEPRAFPERFIPTREFSDGLGRALQSRGLSDDVTLADPGIVEDVDVPPTTAIGSSSAHNPSPAVTVSSWKAYDNKGRVVRVWEPFFDVGWDYRPPASEALAGRLASTVTHYDPRGHPVRVVYANGSEERNVQGVPARLADPTAFVPTPWESYSYDANDNGGRTHPQQTDGWSQQWDTPSSTLVDALGRTIESVRRTATDRHVSRSRHDIDGRTIETSDPLARIASRSVYDLLGRLWVNELLDAGTTLHVPDASGSVIEQRDAKGALVLKQYDPLRRSVRCWCADGAGHSATLRGVTVYGDDATAGIGRPAAAAANLLGRAYKSYDEAGLATAARFDSDGNLVEHQRRVLRTTVLVSGLAGGGGVDDWSGRGYRVDWQPRAGSTLDAHAESLLDPTPYATSSRHDALGRRRKLVLPVDVENRRRTLNVSYGRAGHLTAVDVDGTAHVRQIVYNARGQRVLALLALPTGPQPSESALMVRYVYDASTFRLSRLRAEPCVVQHSAQRGGIRWAPSGAPVQDHGYRYDLVGNLLGLHDRTPGCGVPPADPNRLDRSFRYDPLYRLLSATGRECAAAPPEAWSPVPRCTDVTATRAYREDYTYDPVGNLLQLTHAAGAGSWTSTATVTPGSNRLQSLATAGTSLTYSYDGCGNQAQETSSRRFEWDAGNRLTTFRVQAAPKARPSQYAQYRYDPSGQRVLKVVRDQSGSTATTVYVGGVFERLLLGRQSGATTAFDTLHVLDGAARVTVARIGPAPPGDTSPAVVYHLPDHLGSSEIVVDSAGRFVNREEFTPYGQTTFGSYARKRYRFTGKERDEESGLSYHGARYYAPWLARWTSCDPGGLVDGPNSFQYALNNPLTLHDPTGTQVVPRTQGESAIDKKVHQALQVMKPGGMKDAFEEGISDVAGLPFSRVTPPGNLMTDKLPYHYRLKEAGYNDQQVSALYKLATTHDRVIRQSYWLGVFLMVPFKAWELASIVPNTRSTAVLGLSRTADDEFRGFIEFLRSEGATGPVRAGEGITMLSHGGASKVRSILGLSGQKYQSTHGLPRAVGTRGVPGYDPDAALTRLEEKLIHGRMDQPWKDEFQEMRRLGRTTASGQELYDIVAGSIQQSPDLSPGLKETLQSRLIDEMFVEYGIQASGQLPLPYPNVKPR